MSIEEASFDAEYYERFYGSRRTRVYGATEVGHLARAVTGFAAWFGGEIESVLDVGAGLGHWRRWLRANMPRVRYRSIDVSAYACARYGHEQRDIARWRDEQEQFDLVVCQGVLPYLADEEAEAAIENIAAMCRGFLYLEAITRRDVDEICDPSKTDLRVHRRSGAWYRARLSKRFDMLGCGLFYAKRGPLAFYELEQAPLSPRGG
jgi:SAM-dependent methyltransferase